jgi:menaquinone-dependent protoporphyrinogen IX oxidase
MKGLIVVCSRYGSTQEYADAIASKMQWDVISYKKANEKKLKEADSIVLMSSVRIGKLGLRSWADRYKSSILPKCKAVIAVGGAETDKQDYYIEVVEKQLPFLKLKKEQIFGLGGRKKIAEMKGMDAFMFKMLDKMIKDDDERKKDIMQEVDYVDIKNIDPIVSYLKK